MHWPVPGDRDLAFSSDGDSLAFSRMVGPLHHGDSWPESKNYEAISIVGLDGSNPHQVTNIDPKLPLEFADYAMTFSPDGKRLVVDRARLVFDDHGYLADERHAMVVQPIDSPEDAHQITSWKMNCLDHPEFSPMASWCTSAACPRAARVPSNLYWVHPNGTGLHALTHESADKQYLGSSFSPSFSAGEGWIAVGRTAGYGEEGNADVFRLLIEDGEVVREVNLTKSAIWDSAVDWCSHQPVA
jgi:hypothetical protein